jgi:hypothetical protein
VVVLSLLLSWVTGRRPGWVLFGKRGSLRIPGFFALNRFGFFFVLHDYRHCGRHVWFMTKGMGGQEAGRLPSSGS